MAPQRGRQNSELFLVTPSRHVIHVFKPKAKSSTQAAINARMRRNFWNENFNKVKMKVTLSELFTIVDVLSTNKSFEHFASHELHLEIFFSLVWKTAI